MPDQAGLALVNRLIEERYTKLRDIRLDKDIFLKAISVLNSENCIWCKYSRISGELLRLLSFPDNDCTQWFRQKTTMSLSSCAACLEAYYEIRPKLKKLFLKLYEPHTLTLFWDKVDEFDVNRISNPLVNFVGGQTDSKSPAILFALYELLLYPKHLQVQVLHDNFVRVLTRLIEVRKMIKVTRVLPGLFYCLLDGDVNVHRWANSVMGENSILCRVDKFISESFDLQSLLNKIELTDIEGFDMLKLICKWLPYKISNKDMESILSWLLKSFKQSDFVASAYETINLLLSMHVLQPASEWAKLIDTIFLTFRTESIETDLRWIEAMKKWTIQTGDYSLIDKLFERVNIFITDLPTTAKYSAAIAIISHAIARELSSLLVQKSSKLIHSLLSTLLGHIIENPSLINKTVDLFKICCLLDCAVIEVNLRDCQLFHQLIMRVIQLPRLQNQMTDSLVSFLEDNAKIWPEFIFERTELSCLVHKRLITDIVIDPSDFTMLIFFSVVLKRTSDESLVTGLQSYPQTFVNDFAGVVDMIIGKEHQRGLELISNLIRIHAEVFQKAFFIDHNTTLVELFPDKFIIMQAIVDSSLRLMFAPFAFQKELDLVLLHNIDRILVFVDRMSSESDLSLRHVELPKESMIRAFDVFLKYFGRSEDANVGRKLRLLIEVALNHRIKLTQTSQTMLNIVFSSVKIDSTSRLSLDKTINEYEKKIGVLLSRPPKENITRTHLKRLNDTVDLELEERILEDLQSTKEKRKERSLPISLRSSVIPLATKSGSRLDQLKAEAVRDTIPIGLSQKRRCTHVSISNGPKLDKLDHKVSSASESDCDEFSTLKGKFSGTRSLTIEEPISRSVKLIEIIDSSAKNRPVSRDKRLDANEEVNLVKKFHRKILSFDLSHMDIPPESGTLSAIPGNFNSVTDYISVFEPLLFVECRAQLAADFEDTPNDEIQSLKISSVAHADDFHEVQLQGDPNNDEGKVRLNEQDYLMVSFRNRDGTDGTKVGAVIIQTAFKSGIPEMTLRLSVPQDKASLQLELREGVWLSFLRVGNLITNLREYLALHLIGSIELAPSILNPQISIAGGNADRSVNIDRITAAMKVNRSQAKAITAVVDHVNPIVLIQGPPGTGKTKTIEALLGLIARQQKEKKILICAPSNAAIDEIVRRIRHGLCDANGIYFTIRILRVGALDMISEDVKDLTLESQTDHVLALSITTSNKLLEAQRQSCDNLRRSLVEAEKTGREDKVKSIKTALWEAKENMRKNTKFIEDTRAAIRQKILNEAQIICCTLSSSGHDMLTRLDFGTVIIDEACQAVELSCLVPLQHNVQRCVLVGGICLLIYILSFLDPNQLPPTVISQMAGVFSYEQSLFVRLQKQCPESVLLLDTQYRMHPEISRFPSSYFYEGRLIDGPGMDSLNKRSWHSHPLLGPFRFLDIAGKEENRTRDSGIDSRSKMNEMEAKVAVQLVILLCQNSDQTMVGRIGIVTPYKDQRRTLRKEFGSRFGYGILQSIEISTVDGFQGQEKEVIIFSCVRTTENRGIGFLNDTRRLNVALTRAKCSLFVLGKSSSLMRNPIWGAMIDYAKTHNCYIKYDSKLWQGLRQVRTLPNMHLTAKKNEETESQPTPIKSPSTIMTPAQRRIESQKHNLSSFGRFPATTNEYRR